jgi:hypothetical protein
MLAKRETQSAFTRLYIAMSLVSTLPPTVLGSSPDNALSCSATIQTPRQKTVEARTETSSLDREAFDRYRTTYHFQPESNWINDPCGK